MRRNPACPRWRAGRLKRFEVAMIQTAIIAVIAVLVVKFALTKLSPNLANYL